MKARIETIYGQTGTYMKADRTSDYSILVQFENGQNVWLRTWEISKVKFKESLMTAEKFCQLLLIPFKSNLIS